MKPFPNIPQTDRSFWAHVKLVSEKVGYSRRKTKQNPTLAMRRFEIGDITKCLLAEGLQTGHIMKDGELTTLGGQVLSYLNQRAQAIEDQIEPNLMKREEAKQVFDELHAALSPTCALPMNKQKKEKRHHAYLTGIINMLTEQALGGCHFDADPRGLTVHTDGNVPIHTFPRRMDGAYPGVVNPKAFWEIKEFYGTTSFGSRVSDVVYETMLDGYERTELEKLNGTQICQYLIVDDHYTWWGCGRSYLCRLVDVLNMGLADEILFGREVVSEWPRIVKSWGKA